MSEETPDLSNDDIDQKKLEIISVYLEIISNKQALPSYSDFVAYDISRDNIRSKFGGIETLHKHIQEQYSSIIDKIFISVEKIFNENEIVLNNNTKKYIITTAVADSKPHEGFIKNLEYYAKMHNAQIVIMPCESVTNSFEKKTATFNPIFYNKDYLFVTKDVQLNDNLCLCSIQVSAKQPKPITGLSRLGNREGSFVFASTKQFLEYVPSGNRRGINYSIMTTGACTVSNYYSETFVSKRLSYIAEKDHTLGAIIVDIKDDRYFDFRQIQADENGSFIDFGVLYENETTKEVKTNIVLGDLHAHYEDEKAVNYFIDKFKNLNIDALFLHDTFDGHSINHHITSIAEKAARSNRKESNLAEELIKTHNSVSKLNLALDPDKIYFVKSNHDEFLTRYLADGRYISDPENHYLSLSIAKALFENEDTLKRGFKEVNLPLNDNWIFLDRNSSIKIGGVECASHGDLGLNGAQPSLATLEKVYGNCVVGHTHSAAIQRGVFRVGTLSKLDMGYNRGPSSWTQTCCLLYENGQRQLINFINENN